MFTPRMTTTTVTDGSVKAAKNFKEFRELEVYVGIPESSAARKSGVITNAQLVFIHTHGVRSLDARRIMGAMMLNRKVSYRAAKICTCASHG